MAEWFIAQNNEKFGPFTTAQLKELARTGKVLPTDMLWREEFPGWVKATEAKGLFDQPAAQPPVQQPPVQQPASAVPPQQQFQQPPDVPPQYQQQTDVPPQFQQQPAPGGPIAPPPGMEQREGPSPDAIPAKFRDQPGLPYCTVSITAANAVLKGEFSTQAALNSFVAGLATALKKKYNVRLDAPAPGSPNVMANVIQMDGGNRFLRYMLTFFGGKTVLEIEGEVTGPLGQTQAFLFTHKGAVGLFGGSADSHFKISAAVIAKKAAKLLLKS